MSVELIVWLVVGAAAGGFINGLAGFGTFGRVAAIDAALAGCGGRGRNVGCKRRSEPLAYPQGA